MRVHVRFSGRVQGVGFRATARAIASEHPVTGWVRNEPDGDVTLELQGEPSAVEGVIAELATRMSSQIDRSDRSPMAVEPGEGGFRILR